MKVKGKTKNEIAVLKTGKACSRLLEMAREGVLILNLQIGQNPFMTKLLGYSCCHIRGNIEWVKRGGHS